MKIVFSLKISYVGLQAGGREGQVVDKNVKGGNRKGMGKNRSRKRRDVCTNSIRIIYYPDIYVSAYDGLYKNR